MLGHSCNLLNFLFTQLFKSYLFWLLNIILTASQETFTGFSLLKEESIFAIQGFNQDNRQNIML